MKNIIKANETITKQTINNKEHYFGYMKNCYDERIYICKVIEQNGANVKLDCKLYAYSGGYDFGMKRNFKLEHNTNHWTFEGKIYKGVVTKKGEYINEKMRLFNLNELENKIGNL